MIIIIIYVSDYPGLNGQEWSGLLADIMSHFLLQYIKNKAYLTQSCLMCVSKPHIINTVIPGVWWILSRLLDPTEQKTCMQIVKYLSTANSIKLFKKIIPELMLSEKDCFNL